MDATLSSPSTSGSAPPTPAQSQATNEAVQEAAQAAPAAAPEGRRAQNPSLNALPPVASDIVKDSYGRIVKIGFKFKMFGKNKELWWTRLPLQPGHYQEPMRLALEVLAKECEKRPREPEPESALPLAAAPRLDSSLVVRTTVREPGQLSPEAIAALGKFIVTVCHDTHAPDGRPFVPSRNEALQPTRQLASLCGGFPHLLLLDRRARSDYFVAQRKDVELKAKLTSTDGISSNVETELLKTLERHTNLRLDRLLFRVDLVLVTQNQETVDVDFTPQTGSFKSVPDSRKLLVPGELSPDDNGYNTTADPYVRPAVAGSITYNTFKISHGIANSNLASALCAFQFRISPVDERLRNIPSLTAHSLTFNIKAAINQDVRRNERYVTNADGKPVPYEALTWKS